MSNNTVSIHDSARQLARGKHRFVVAGVSKNGGASLAWVISFGDLLTLILCFFVVVLTLKVPGITEEKSSKQEVSAQGESAPPIGTSLANARNEVKELSISRQLLDPSTGLFDIPLRGDITRPGGPEALAQQMQASKELQKLSPRSVRLVLCGDRKSRGEVVHGVTRALRDADFSSLAFSLERRARCGSIVDDRATEDEKIGVLSFLRGAE